MIFLDTCVWIELLGVHAPVKLNEIKQAQAATELLTDIRNKNMIIVSCREQLIELIKSIEKITLRSVNRDRKENNISGIGDLKMFRKQAEYVNTKELCKSVIDDLRNLAQIKDFELCDIDDILKHLELADINDYIYYEYCTREKINFYTFDSDLDMLEKSEYIHIYNFYEEKWK